MNREKWMKVAKGALIAGLGATIAYVAQAASGGDFGSLSAVVGAICSVLINAVNQYFKPAG